MDLYERVLALAPAVAERFVFMSACARTTRAEEFLERVPNLRLDKPFGPATAREFIQRFLWDRRRVS
jgi:hypothetical protein